MRTLLEDEGFEVRDAPNGRVGVALCRSFAPDVAIMDVNMPEMSGIDATRLLLRERPDTAVLMLTVTEDDERVIEAVRAGASGYMLKDAALDEIVAGMRATAAGQSAIAPRVGGALVASVRTAAPASERVPAATPDLSPREREVLELLATGLKQAEIARRLVITPKTVGTHIERILRKLDVHSRAEAVAVAYRRELVNAAD